MTFFRKHSSFRPAALGLLLFGTAALAQETSQPVQSVSQPPMVKLNVIVLDSKNNPVTDLRQEDFHVFEGDTPQTISHFSKEDVPISYGLLIDSSGSLKTQFKGVIGAANTVIKSNGPDDETLIVRFISSDKIELTQDFTSNKEVLHNSLNSIQVEGGQTAVIDALYVAAERIGKHRPEEDIARRRRALILISDGEDRNSSFKKDELSKLLRKQNIQIFIIGLIGELDKDGGHIRKSAREKAVALLEELAKETGGLAFFPRSASELQTVSSTIVRHLHTQYLIGYSPIKVNEGSYRKARIKLVDVPGRDKRRVVARPGYTLPR